MGGALSGAGLRTSRASWPSSWAGHRRRAHAALQPTASAAHGPKLHSHGPLTSFRCRFVCGITSQKKSYQTCPAAFGLGGLEQHLWGEAGAVVSACMQGRASSVAINVLERVLRARGCRCAISGPSRAIQGDEMRSREIKGDQGSSREIKGDQERSREIQREKGR